MNSDQYQGQFNGSVNQGYRLDWVSGYAVGGVAFLRGPLAQRVDERRRRVPPSTPGSPCLREPAVDPRAVNRRRRRTSGWYSRRDTGTRTPASKAPVTPDSVFRIASISKPITAVAIMELVEAGKLNLRQPRSSAPAPILGTTYGTRPYAANVKQITVHRARVAHERVVQRWRRSDVHEPFHEPGAIDWLGARQSRRSRTPPAPRTNI